MKKFLSCLLALFIIVGSLFAVTDSDILAASKLLEISYEDLKIFVDQYHTQKEESKANSLSENEIIKRLKTIPGVKGVQAATETNDPNGGLNKPGKYVSAIYFELENVDQSYFDANLDIMLMYGKEASNRKQEIDRQHYTIPNQRPKDKHCGKI